MINGEAYELPAFVGMAIFAAAMRAFTHDPPCGRGHRHVRLTGVVQQCVPGD
jgi:hypothetical protein